MTIKSVVVSSRRVIGLHGVDMEFSFSGKWPSEMNFAATNVAEMWRRWRQNMQFYINATMAKKTEKEKNSSFLFLNRRGRSRNI